MRAVVSFAVLVCLGAPCAWAKSLDLPPLPEERSFWLPSTEAIWSDYTKAVLKKVVPTHHDLIDRIEVLVKYDPVIDAANEPGPEPVLMFSSGMANFVRTPQEFAAVVAHDLAHIFYNHPKPLLADGTPNWKLVEQQELEADFFSLVVLGGDRAVLKLLERFRRYQRTRGELGTPENSKITNLRIQTLKNILDHSRIGQLRMARTLPEKLPAWTASLIEWQIFTRMTLLAAFPGQKKLIYQLRIVVEADGLDLKFGDREGIRYIWLDTPVLAATIRSVQDFALMIAHEFGHALAYRDYDLDYLHTDVSHDEQKLIRRKQIEADLFAILTFEKSECAWADYLDRLLEFHRDLGLRSQENFDWERSTRIGGLRAMCELNY